MSIKITVKTRLLVKTRANLSYRLMFYGNFGIFICLLFNLVNLVYRATAQEGLIF